MVGVLGLARSAKPAYFFCRYIDDFADGESLVKHPQVSFDELITTLKGVVAHPQKKYKDTLQLTLVDAILKLKKSNVDLVIIQKEFSAFLDSMLFDYKRRTETCVLSQGELLQLYDASFKPILHIALIGLGVGIEEEYIFLLGRLQARLYAIQDMEYELTKNIINLPKELIQRMSCSLDDIVSSPKTYLNDMLVVEWRNQEYKACATYVKQLRGLDLHDKKSIRMMDVLMNPLEEDLKNRMDKEL